jgi:hypothetical protein
MLSIIFGAGIGGAVYALAKKRKASTPTAAVTATAAGVGGAVVTGLMLSAATVVVPIAVVGGLGYWFLRRGKAQKALGPGR